MNATKAATITGAEKSDPEAVTHVDLLGDKLDVDDLDEAILASRILIVDDESSNVQLLELLLARLGYTNVESTTDPRNAEGLFRHHQHDLVLLDLMMPHMDGFEVMRRLRALVGADHYMPILVLTADTTSETKNRVLASGAQDYVGKPFDLTEIAHRIRNLLEVRQLHMTLSQRIAAQTKDLERSRRAFEYQAYHDPLTGLLNKSLFRDRLAHALRHLANRPGKIATLVVDIDNFKAINTAIGHTKGDEYLTEIAKRLSSALLPTDTLARFDSDKFVVLLDEITDPAEATQLAERLASSLARPINLNGSDHNVTCCIGITIEDDPSADIDDVLRFADIAMYKAKERGPGSLALHSLEMDTEVIRTLNMANALRHAFEHDRLFLEYQPIIELGSGQLVGAEALLRWTDDQYGQVQPAEFIRIAETTGSIVELGQWALRTACRQLHAWLFEHDSLLPFVLNVNLSARQLAEPNMVEMVRSALQDGGVAAERLCLELTEAALLSDISDARAKLVELKRLGVVVAIDDFGTGYGSLTYLQQFPVDTIKIDTTFVAGLGKKQADEALVQAQISLAKAFGLSVIAEGVETELQAEMLRELGCQYAQGYLFARPESPDAFTERLAVARL